MTDSQTFTFNGVEISAEELAIARQELAHQGTGYVPPWAALTVHEREMSVLDARNYLLALARLVAS